MRTVKQCSWIAVAVLAFATLTSAPARAEYRCATPGLLFYGEMRACELAGRDSPDALIHFVNRTKGVFGLYAPDYISQVDAQRWEMSRQQKAEPAPEAVAKASPAAKGDSKSD
jgi:hypothetical protein